MVHGIYFCKDFVCFQIESFASYWLVHREKAILTLQFLWKIRPFYFVSVQKKAKTFLSQFNILAASKLNLLKTPTSHKKKNCLFTHMKWRNYSVQANDWLFHLWVTRDKVLSKYLTAILIIHSFSFQKQRWSLQYFMNLSYYDCRHTKFKHSTVQVSNQNGVDFDPFHCNRVRCFLLSALSGLCFGKITSEHLQTVKGLKITRSIVSDLHYTNIQSPTESPDSKLWLHALESTQQKL